MYGSFEDVDISSSLWESFWIYSLHSSILGVCGISVIMPRWQFDYVGIIKYINISLSI